MITPRNPMGRSSSPDDDPTGVRELLSSLPDPGPMPPELVARIGATLAREQDLRAEDAPEGAGAAAPVAPLVRRRPRRAQVLTGIAGAAAAVIVGFVGVNALNNGPTPSSASLASGAESGATSPGSKAPSGSGGAVQQPATPSAGAPGPRSAGPLGTPSAGSPGQAAGGGAALRGTTVGAVWIRTTGTDYRPHTFAAQAGALPSAGDRQSVTPPGHEAVGTIGTAAGLRSCLEGLGVGRSLGAGSVTADVARYAEAPAAVIVLSVDGTRRAWAVGRDCSAEHPHVLHGPVTLP